MAEAAVYRLTRSRATPTVLTIPKCKSFEDLCFGLTPSAWDCVRVKTDWAYSAQEFANEVTDSEAGGRTTGPATGHVTTEVEPKMLGILILEEGSRIAGSELANILARIAKS